MKEKYDTVDYSTPDVSQSDFRFVKPPGWNFVCRKIVSSKDGILFVEQQ